MAVNKWRTFQVEAIMDRGEWVWGETISIGVEIAIAGNEQKFLLAKFQEITSTPLKIGAVGFGIIEVCNAETQEPMFGAMRN